MKQFLLLSAMLIGSFTFINGNTDPEIEYCELEPTTLIETIDERVDYSVTPYPHQWSSHDYLAFKEKCITVAERKGDIDPEGFCYCLLDVVENRYRPNEFGKAITQNIDKTSTCKADFALNRMDSDTAVEIVAQ